MNAHPACAAHERAAELTASQRWPRRSRWIGNAVFVAASGAGLTLAAPLVASVVSNAAGAVGWRLAALVWLASTPTMFALLAPAAWPAPPRGCTAAHGESADSRADGHPDLSEPLDLR